MSQNAYFDGIIGQEKAKRKLSLYIDGYMKTSLLPNLLFEGAMGAGKTMLAHRVANTLGKEWFEINGATIKNAKQFAEEILMETQDKECLLFVDELHAAPKSVFDLLLSVTNPTAAHKNTVTLPNGIELEFDFHKISFMFATTETQKVFKPLLSRLTPVTLSDYDTLQLATIIKANCGNVPLKDDAAFEVATYTRGTGRSASLMGQEIYNYCNAYDLTTFAVDEVAILMEILDIYPLGLTEQEITTLAHIRNSKGGITLTGLSSKTGHTRDSQQNIESYLQKHGLMRVEGTRQITQSGIEYLKKVGR